MKKVLSAIILTVTMFFLIVLPASAETGSLSTNAKLSADGTSFTVELIVKDNPGVIALTGKVSYDDKAFKLTSVQNGEIFENIFMSSQNLSVNPYNTIWMEATAEEDIKTNGLLISYTFEILKTAPMGESELKFEIADAVNNAQDSNVSFKGCSFKVKIGEKSSAQNITDNEVIEVQPSGNSSQPESSFDDSEQSSSSKIVASTDNVVDDQVKEQNNDRITVTVLTIVAILVLGVAITLTAVYFRKKSAKGNNEE